MTENKGSRQYKIEKFISARVRLTATLFIKKTYSMVPLSYGSLEARNKITGEHSNFHDFFDFFSKKTSTLKIEKNLEISIFRLGRVRSRNILNMKNNTYGAL